jgi:hypothetical protein
MSSLFKQIKDETNGNLNADFKNNVRREYS